MICFLNGVRVTDKETKEKIRPKASYFSLIRSFLTTELTTLTGTYIHLTNICKRFEQSSGQ